MSDFRQFDCGTRFLLPPSLDEWLPGRYLARFVVEVIDGLDLLAMVKAYRGPESHTGFQGESGPCGYQRRWPCWEVSGARPQSSRTRSSTRARVLRRRT